MSLTFWFRFVYNFNDLFTFSISTICLHFKRFFTFSPICLHLQRFVYIFNDLFTISGVWRNLKKSKYVKFNATGQEWQRSSDRCSDSSQFDSTDFFRQIEHATGYSILGSSQNRPKIHRWIFKKLTKKFVKVCLHFKYLAQNSFHFDEFY